MPQKKNLKSQSRRRLPIRCMSGLPCSFTSSSYIVMRKMPGVLSTGWSTMTPLSGRDRSIVVDVPGFVPGIEGAEVRVNQITGKIVTVIRFSAPGAK
jgi:hypothetical protein